MGEAGHPRASLPIVAIILNNARLGMVDQWQSMFSEERRSQSDLRKGMPWFATIARSYGAEGYDVRTVGELRDALAQALDRRRPTVIDVRVDPDEACLPMIPPGGAPVEQMEWHDRS